MKKRILLLTYILFSVLPSLAQVDVTRHTLDHNGHERTYELYVPDDLPDDAPLLIALHQFASSARAMQLLTDLNTMADEMGMLVAYPENFKFGWNNGTGDIERGYFSPDLDNPDDLGYIEMLIDTLANDYNIDTEQVYVVGSGNGGLMASYLACQIPDKLAGVISVGATMWDYQADVCPETLAEPIDILYMMGMQDWVYPIDGRNFQLTPDRPLRFTVSFRESMEFWATRNGCEVSSAYSPLNTLHVAYNDCESDVRTYLYVVAGGGSGWFGDYTVTPTGITTEAILEAFITGDPLEDFPQQDLADVPEEGRPRSYRLYVPTGYDPAEPMPIVVALHGRPDTGIGFSIITQLHLTAERENFLVLYPDGINLGWNYVNGIRNFGGGDVWDDVQHLEDLVLTISEQVNVDLNRVYATGFSNGGFMTQRLACEAYDFFAAFAVSGATMVPGMEPLCNPDNDVPIMFIHGTADVSIPWRGSETSHYGVIQNLYYWVTYNDCNLEPTEEVLPSTEDNPETFVGLITYEDCAFGGDLLFYGVQNGGHNWMGVPDVIGEEIAGLVNTDYHASDLVWEYMSQFTLDDTQGDDRED